MADAHLLHQNAMDVEDAYSCVEDPAEPQSWTKIVDQEVDQPLPRIDIILNFNHGVQPAGKKLPPRAQSLIGQMIYKKCAGIGYLGTVVDYDVTRRWFKVEYENEGSEDLLEAEVRNLLATPTQIEQHLYLQRLREAVNNMETHVPAAGEGASSSRPKRKRMGKSAGKEDEGTYVPMYKRPSMRDDYFYF